MRVCAQFHFETLPTAIITLFRMATMEDWTDVMYINYYGCYSQPPEFDSGFYTNNDDMNITYRHVNNRTVYQCDASTSSAGGVLALL